MKNTKYLVLVLSLIMIAGVFTLFAIDRNTVTPYTAKEGTLNLDSWDMKTDGIITLNGEWLFYPYQLRKELESDTHPLIKEVPHWWESDTEFGSPFGFGTYQLHLSGLIPLQVYGINVMDEVTSFSLYVNNELITSNGIVSDQRKSYKPEWRPIIAVFKANKDGEALLEMEIANFDYYRGGFWNSPNIGEVSLLFSSTNKEKARELFLFTSIFIMGLINLALFITYKEDKTTYYLALFCFSMSFRILLIGQRLVTNILSLQNWHLLVRMEYLLGYLLLPLFALFTIHLFDVNCYQIKIKRAFFLLIAFFILVTLVLPTRLYSDLMEPYKWLSFLFALYFAYLLYRFNEKNRLGTIVMFLGILGMLLSILHEIFIGGVVSWLPFATLCFIMCFSLITFQQFLNILKKNEILEAKIIRDPLTGLYNRFYIMGLEDSYLNPVNHLHKYLMFLDLDNFKGINDTFGHKIGDFILQEASNRFSGVIRSSDIICRYGGDEFIILLTVENYEEVVRIAQRIIQVIQEPFCKDGAIYNIGVSIGIVESLTDMHNIDTLIKNSDEAMYEAKNKGRNQYVFYSKSITPYVN